MYYCPDVLMWSIRFFQESAGRKVQKALPGGGPCYFQTKTEFCSKMQPGQEKVCVSLHLHADH